jgi:hypothetical protein
MISNVKDIILHEELCVSYFLMIIVRRQNGGKDNLRLLIKGILPSLSATKTG